MEHTSPALSTATVPLYVDPPHYLRCVICTDVMRAPVSLTCGHSFCSECCDHSLEFKPECPCCRQAVFRPPYPNISLRQALEEQLVHCPFGPTPGSPPTATIFQIDSKGCNAIISKAECAAHELECPFRWATCGILDHVTNERCEVRCRWNELEEHKKQCDFLPVRCPNEGCNDRVSARSLLIHRGRCGLERVPCPNSGCSEHHLRNALPAHQEHCLFRVVLCPFHKYGCVIQGSATAVQSHVESSAPEHLLLLSNLIEFHEERQKQDKRAASPHKTFQCIVHDFDRLAQKQVIDMDLDCSWRLKIWPNGEDRRHRGYVSIRLFSREADPSFRVEGPYTMRIINHLDRSRNIVKMTEALSREWADSVRGWGFPAFAKTEDVMDPSEGFLKDSRLLIEVEVIVSGALQIVEYHPDPEEEDAKLDTTP